MPPRQMSVLRFLRIPAAAITAALALWFTHASLDVFSGARGPTRVAMLPAWLELVGLVLVALGVCLGLSVVAWRRRGPTTPEDAAARDLSDAFVPLFALVALALPYLPFVPDWVPLLRVLAGRGKYLLWVVVGAQVAWIALEPVSRRVAPARLRGGAALVFIIALAIFGAAAWRATGSVLFPGGDEPHYLIVAQSLWRDHDLKIENNHARRDYAEYYDGVLRPHYQTRGKDGAIYSIHPVGLPAAIAPVYALGKYRGVAFFLVLLGALTSALMWQWVRRLTGSAATATFAWAAVALSAPYLFGSFIIYPEMAAALCVIVAFAGARQDTRLIGWVLAGLAIAALPWLSTKYAPMAMALLFVCLWRAHRGAAAGLTRAAIISLAFAASLAAWFAFFYFIWGTPLPTAPYVGTDEQMQIAYLASGAPGLLFDQEYGIMAYAPVLLLALTGLATMWRKGGEGRVTAFEITAVFVSLLATVGAYHIWWGGSATPGRPLVSGLPLLAAPIAWQYMNAVQPARRAAHQLLLVVTISITAILVLAQGGFLVALARSGKSPLLEWFSPAWHLWALAPSFLYHGVAMAAAFAVVWLGIALASRPILDASRHLRPGAAALAATSTALTASLAISVLVPALFGSSLQPDVSLEARGRILMLDGFDSHARPLAIAYDPVRRLAPADVPPLFTFSAVPGLRRAPQPVRLMFNARLALPAGRYVAEIRSAPGDPREAVGEVALQIGRVGDPISRWEARLRPGHAWRHEFSLPIDSGFVGFRAAPSIGDVASELHIRPVRVVDAHQRAAVQEVLGARSYAAATVYFHDEQVWPERTGFWTRGESTVPITITPTSGGGVTLKVRSGERPNVVVLDSGSWRRKLDLQPGTIRDVRVPPGPLSGIISLRVTSEGGFTPASVESGSTDQRFLGCWIEIASTEGS